MGGSQPTGWPRREFFDERDKYYVPNTYFDLQKMSLLNLRTNDTYKSYFAKSFYNQSPATTSLDYRTWGTCTANATAAAFVYEWNCQGLPAVNPSRLFIYFNARQIAFNTFKQPWTDPTNTNFGDQGTFIRLAFKNLDQRGVCAEDDWAYDDAHFAKQPDDAIIKKALGNRVLQYSRVDPDQPEGVETHLTDDEKDIIGSMTLLRLRQSLAEGHPDTNSGFWTLPPLPSKTGPSGNFGGHAVLAVGFDDSAKRILCQNSWGDSGEGAPLFWIGYDWIKDFEATSDFWMMRLLEKK